MGEVVFKVSGADVVALKSWSSIWADLTHVWMVLHSRKEIAVAPGNLFVRRALWEGAVIGYGRTAKQGARQVLIRELLDELGPEGHELHDSVLSWRDKHVAHRVDSSREQVTALGVIDDERRLLKGVHVRVSPVVGEEDGGDLADDLFGHVEALRTLCWTLRLLPLQAAILAPHVGRVDDLIAEADARLGMPDGYFSLDLRPWDELVAPPTTGPQFNRAERRRQRREADRAQKRT